MFINDVHKKEEIQNIAVQHLKKYGIKYRPKKPRPPQQVSGFSTQFSRVLTSPDLGGTHQQKIF